MKRSLFVLAVVFVLVPAIALGASRRLASAPAGAAAARFAPREVLVVSDDVNAVGLAPDARVRAMDARVVTVLAQFGLERAERIAETPGSGGGTRRYLKLVSTRRDFDPVAASVALNATGAFVAVSPNFTLRLFDTVPNDLYFDYQWGLHSSNGADIQIPAAWDIAKGDTGTVIAVMDNGIDIGHPDLAAQIYTNRAEIPGNHIDDDGNGFIDDVHGWDFGRHDNDPSPEEMLDEGGIDEGFHGTFVTGIASASTNNTEGIAGAGWRCRILPLRVADSTGAITTDAVTAAFAYVVARHPQVLNMSFGGNDPIAGPYFQALVDDATAAGVMCVAAAGNDSTNVPNYPAACAHVLSVGATDEEGARAWFSSYGATVDVAAPGDNIWSSIARNYELDFLQEFIYELFFGYDGVNPYMYGSGTSFSSPLVAGVCGLVRARFPYLTPDQAAAHIIATGDVVAYDYPIGRKVNALAAVSTVPVGVGDAPVIAGVALAPGAPNPFVSRTTLRYTLPRDANATLAIYDCAGRVVRVLANGSIPAGAHAATWDGADAEGRRVDTGMYFARLVVGRTVASSKLVRIE